MAGLTHGFRPTSVTASHTSSLESERLKLLTKILSPSEGHPQGYEEFQRFESLIRKEFYLHISDIGMPGSVEVYAELLGLLDELKDLVYFPHLANKNIIAICGAFSAGKSSFLNSIFGVGRLLKTGDDPTTAIPTYLTNGPEETIRALNISNHTQYLTRKEANSLTHLDNDNQSVDGRIAYSRILKTLQIESPKMEWKNIALLDTPGYSKPHTGLNEQDEKSDAEMAQRELAKADYLIWVVSVDDGTLHESSKEFLKKAKWKRKPELYLLINMADKKSPSELKAVYDQICGDVVNAGLKLIGASAYSSLDSKVLLGDDPKDWFRTIDGRRNFTKTWRTDFLEQLTKVRDFCAQCKERGRMYSSVIGEACLKLVGLDDKLSSNIEDVHKSLCKWQQTNEEAIRPLDIFCSEVERQLDRLLTAIGVADETAADSAADVVGVVAVYNGANYIQPDAQLMALGPKKRIVGKVAKYSKFVGCYIVTPAATSEVHQITISPKDLSRSYTDPESCFGVGRGIELVVYDVSPHQKKVTFIAKPQK